MPWMSSRLVALILLVLTLLCAGLTVQARSANFSPENAEAPLSRLGTGQYLVPVMVNGQGPFQFVIDSAATRTSLFERMRAHLDLEPHPIKQRFVMGMITSAMRPTLRIDHLAFAGQNYKALEVILLDNWPQTEDAPDGILGMDILQDLTVYVEHENNRIRIKKKKSFSDRKYKKWQRLQLAPSPYPAKGYGLLFTDMKLGDRRVSAMIDTGAGFTAINWKSVHGTKLSDHRKRLREEWVVQGAIGEFVPRVRIHLDRMHIGSKLLKGHELLIMDFENLPFTQGGQHPMAIAGIDIFQGGDFVFDFPRKQIFLAPDPH